MREQLANLLCQNFYKFIEVTGDPNPRDLIPGRFVVAHNVYPPEEPWIIEVLRYHPTDESLCNYRVKRFSPHEDRSHMPIAELPIARKALHNFLKGSPSQPVALSDEAFALFINHLGRYLLGNDLDKEICQDIDSYRGLVLEAVGRI